MNKLTNYRVVSLWVLVLIVMLVWISRTIQIQSDLSLFLPRQQSTVSSLLMHELSQGSAARTLFIGIDGGTLQQRTRMSQLLVNKLQSSQLFEHIFNGQQQLKQAEIDWLLKYRYLLSPGISKDHFSEKNLKLALQQRLDEFALPVPTPDKQYISRDPSVELRAILSRIQANKSIPKHDGVWVSDDGSRALLITQTAGSAVDLDRQQQVVDFIESSFSQLNSSSAVNIQLTGLPAASILSRKLIQSESRVFSLLASVALLAILLMTFRSAKLVLLSALPLMSAVITGLFAVLTWFNSIHGITLVFAITILGIAIDYPLHLFSHLDNNQSPTVSVRKIWSTMRLGLLTTMTAFLTLTFSNFEGLLQLGLFTASGLLMAALTTRYILPLFIATTKIRTQPSFTIPVPARGPGWIIIALALIFIMVIFSGQLPQWEKNLSSLSPLPDSYIKRDKLLRSTLGASDLHYIALIQGNSLENVLQYSESVRPVLDDLVKKGIIQHYNMAANYLPSQVLQQQRKTLLPTQTQLKKSLHAALDELPFKQGIFQPFIQEIEQTRQGGTIAIDDLKEMPFEAVVNSLLMQQSGSYFAIIRFNGAVDGQRLVEHINRVESNDSGSISLHDLPQISSSLLNQFYADFLAQIAIAVFIIVLMLLISLRQLRRTLVVTSVLFLSLLLEISLLVAIGQHFTLFHLVSLILVFGLGLDYALFFSRDEPVSEKQKTFYGLLVCVISSILVFGILALSRIPVLHIIGMTTAIGVSLSFFFSMLMTSLFLKDTQKI